MARLLDILVGDLDVEDWPEEYQFASQDRYGEVWAYLTYPTRDEDEDCWDAGSEGGRLLRAFLIAGDWKTAVVSREDWLEQKRLSVDHEVEDILHPTGDEHFHLSDLRPGLLVRTYHHALDCVHLIVCEDKEDLIDSDGCEVYNLSEFNEDLTHNSDHTQDIVEVLETNSLWKRGPKKMTLTQVCKALGREIVIVENADDT